eukprot:SM000297S10933  [mRNA]  locus=s297:106352:107057:- [translate_table: standard]
MSSASVPITLAGAALLMKIASRASASMSAECAHSWLAHRYSVLWGLRAVRPRTLVSPANVCAALRTRVAAFAPPAALLARFVAPSPLVVSLALLALCAPRLRPKPCHGLCPL